MNRKVLATIEYMYCMRLIDLFVYLCIYRHTIEWLHIINRQIIPLASKCNYPMIQSVCRSTRWSVGHKFHFHAPIGTIDLTFGRETDYYS